MAGDGGIHAVHALRARPRGVFAVHQVLHHPAQLGTPRRPLVEHFVANAPHRHGGVVAVMAHDVRQVALHPLVVELVVSVGHLFRAPFVEGLHHQEHARLVAGPHQFGRRHVVRCAVGVAAHVLQQLQAVADGLFVDGRAQRSQVMMVARAPQHQLLAVEEKALVGDDLHGADAERRLIGVAQGSLVIHLRVRPVKMRMAAIPKLRVLDHEVLLQHALVVT